MKDERVKFLELDEQKARSIFDELLRATMEILRLEDNAIILSRDYALDSFKEDGSYSYFFEIDNSSTFNVVTKRIKSTSESHWNMHGSYFVKLKGERYKINFYDSPIFINDGVHYFNKETDIFTRVIKFDNDGKRIEYSLTFAFNVENLTFVELYSVVHRTINREYKMSGYDFNEAINKEYKDVDLTEMVAE